ncbi:MAG: acyl-CoA thioesterase II [Archangium sp.]|nr:acyl-CoA thioesterase II [Archangium sp.]MDP3155870.1 acyl-CoA thioesterase II [Archangium sp.]MDP3575420.1 acyl-CoA thioesterase II [Archangium sp.]
MATVLDELIKLLSLERIEENLYRGQSQDLGWGTVYGGQVIGQALFAALHTVPADRPVHSLHAYFLRPGDVSAPIVYDVDRSRDGSSFTTRRVKAIQHGHPIFDMSASFQKVEPGFDHQIDMPQVPPPEQVPTDQERFAKAGDLLPEFMRDRALAERPIEIRTVGEPDVFLTGKNPPERCVWFKATAVVPETPGLHQALLAYASDFSFITTSLKPHGATWLTPGMQVASVDHAVWFHAAFRADEWLLHVMESPRASGARGLVNGRIYSRDGRLVASTAQQGLIRKR